MGIKIDEKKHVIVRTYSAGVFFGKIKEKNGKEIIMSEARRLWYWSGAASLSQLAMNGVKYPDNCKFPCNVYDLILTEVIEIIPCTDKAIKSIHRVREWEV